MSATAQHSSRCFDFAKAFFVSNALVIENMLLKHTKPKKENYRLAFAIKRKTFAFLFKDWKDFLMLKIVSLHRSLDLAVF